MAGGTIIIPIDISTADTTRSMMRNGSETRNPISNARWISDSMKDGTSTDSAGSAVAWVPWAGGAGRPVPSCGPAPGRPGATSASAASVSGSVRAAMKSRNGRMPRSNASGTVMTPCCSGAPAVSHASRRTGSMTNHVRNIARLTISMFGGDCCSPIDWRRIDRTVTTNGKQVTMIAKPGASDRSVRPRKIRTALLPRPCAAACAASSIPCAPATCGRAAARAASSPAAAMRRRRPPVVTPVLPTGS